LDLDETLVHSEEVFPGKKYDEIISVDFKENDGEISHYVSS